MTKQTEEASSADATAPKVAVFFYGSFINLEVLAKSDLRPDEVEVARLPGFDLRIQPLANIVRSDRHVVYGIVCEATHAELTRIYGQDWVGTYLPEAVLVETDGGRWIPALCYIDPSPKPAPAALDYIERIAGPARAFGFPDWYVERIEGFRVSSEQRNA